jgi:pimeloyl-ACP methyl ester carboxylesterase
MTTYQHREVRGFHVFYREAGTKDAPTIVLLHGFPSSSHMFRELIPRLAEQFHVIAPDMIGFCYSAQPTPSEFQYTFDNLAAVTEELLFGELKLKGFSVYVQDYGAPVGFRVASRHPEAIEALIVQNGNAYAEGLSAAWQPLRALWAERSSGTERAVREFLSPAATKFQYTHGAKDLTKISPDSYTADQLFLDRPGNDAVQLELFYNYASNLVLYPHWQAYFRTHQPPTLLVWGINDPFFTVEGAQAFQRDLPKAELYLLDTGHFALEEESETIAKHIVRFLGATRAKAKSTPV